MTSTCALSRAPWRRKKDSALPVDATSPLQECTPTVKNTFITLECLPASFPPRRKSVPASMGLCLGSPSNDSDVSTDAPTDGSESGLKTPVDMGDHFLVETYPALLVEPPTALLCDQEWPEEISALNQYFMPAFPEAQFECYEPEMQVSSSFGCSQCEQPIQKLSSKASCFKPRSATDEAARQHYKDHFAGVMKSAMTAIRLSGHVANVEISDDTTGWSITIQPQGEEEWLTDLLLTVAKEALLSAASQSKCMYVMGYCAPKPFIMRSQGFEAMLGAMESPSGACWHVFKKGFCRHGDECKKQHPPCQMPVHVLVERVQAPMVPVMIAQGAFQSDFVAEFKQDVAELAMSVTSSLNACPYTHQVKAFKTKDYQGWNIEITLKEDSTAHKEYLLSLAKNALFEATNNSNNVYIMGYAAKPFTTKSQGFVSILGDMPDESKACWDLYSKGFCCRERECRWQHPQCLTPINVMLKDSFAKSLNTALECLVDKNARKGNVVMPR